MEGWLLMLTGNRHTSRLMILIGILIALAVPGIQSQSECDEYPTMHPAWFWCDDFETQHDITVDYDDYSTNGFSVTTIDPFQGSYSLRQHYEQGQVEAGWISKFYCDTLSSDYGPCHDTLYMRWYHKFEPGFEGLPPKMARITSIGAGWDKRFGVHHWIENNVIVADVHAQFSSQANDAGWLATAYSNFDFRQHIGEWVCLEMMVKKNTPGQSDGAYIFWANDTVIINRSDVDLVGSTSYNFNNAMLDAHWNDGSPKAQNRYYDNLVISTERIGCLGSGPAPPEVHQCTEADTDSDGSITNSELQIYLSRWQSSADVTISELLAAIRLWKGGCA
jgi:hypothetical protein